MFSESGVNALLYYSYRIYIVLFIQYIYCIIYTAEDACDNLNTFALVSEDDVHKLVIKSKTQMCS